MLFTFISLVAEEKQNQKCHQCDSGKKAAFSSYKSPGLYNPRSPRGNRGAEILKISPSCPTRELIHQPNYKGHNTNSFRDGLHNSNWFFTPIAGNGDRILQRNKRTHIKLPKSYGPKIELYVGHLILFHLPWGCLPRFSAEPSALRRLRDGDMQSHICSPDLLSELQSWPLTFCWVSLISKSTGPIRSPFGLPPLFQLSESPSAA